MLDTVTAPPASGEVVRPGNHTSTHSLAVALDRLSKDLLNAPNRAIAAGELFDGYSTTEPWIDCPVLAVAA